MSKVSWKSVLVGIAIGALFLASAPAIADIGDPVIQGKTNNVDKRTTMRGFAQGVMLRIVQEAPDQPGLSVFTEPGTPPFKVNRKARVENLNADMLDGRNRSFFEPNVPQPGDAMQGTFAVSGTGTLLDDASFSNELRYAIPQPNITYIDYNAPFTTECPAFHQAAAGHLCIYATWNFNATFNAIAGVDTDFLNMGTSTFGFAILWNSGEGSANVRGHWVHTVPSSPPADFPELSDSQAQTTDFGLIAGS